eukprot:TRINITY_DN13932_c0_g2_i1.p1 TRINITY_DN13932_c0_g2~~TRINITY_DN13932_c0_g2_i1.p1  ORF type:complete len:991 (+),score=167.23 TRINITY_DN13932_c0_g2_i1:70-3042(+)
MDTDLRVQLGLIIFLLNLGLVVILASALSVVGYDALDKIGKDMARDTVLKVVNKTVCTFEDPLGKADYISKVATLNFRISTVGRYGSVGMNRTELPYWGAYHGSHLVSTPIITELTYMDVYGDRMVMKQVVPDHPNIFPFSVDLITAGDVPSTNLIDNSPMISRRYKVNRQFHTISVVNTSLAPASNDHRYGAYWSSYTAAGVDNCWVLDPTQPTNQITVHRVIKDTKNGTLGAFKTVANLSEIIAAVGSQVVGVTGRVYVAYYDASNTFGRGMYRFLIHPAGYPHDVGVPYVTENTANKLITDFLRSFNASNPEYKKPSYAEWSHGDKYSVGWIVLGDPGCGTTSPPYVLILMAPLKDFQKEADKAKNEFLIIALCIGLFGVGLAVGLWLMVNSAVTPLITAIHQTTELRFDNIKETKSSISEFNKISDALQYLVNRLAEYMKYLPDGVRAVPETQEIEVQSNVPPPQGDNVTIVFTDIQKSTFLWNTDAHAMSDSLAKHNNLFRMKMPKFQGYEVKTIGDAFMIAFPTYELALSFCFEMQMALLVEDWPEDLLKIDICSEVTAKEHHNDLWRGLRVRMAVASGPVSFETNPLTHRTEYVGKTVCKSARIEGLACGGMILTLAENIEALKETNPGLLKDCKLRSYPDQDLAEFGKVNLTAVYPKELVERADEAYLQTKEWKEKQMKDQQVSKSESSSMMSSVANRPVCTKTQKEFGTKLMPTMGTIASVEAIPELGQSVFDHLTTVSYIVEEAVERCKGAIVQISGVRFDVAWNAGKKCTGHPLQAVLFAANIHKEFGSKQIVRVGVSTGQVLHGRVGSDNKRFKIVVGTAMNMAVGLCGLCSRVGAKLLISEVHGIPCAVHDPSLSASFRLILILRQSNLEEFINIHEANTRALSRSNAWSYITTDEQSSFTVTGLTDAIKLAATGDLSALASICEYLPFDSTITAAYSLFKEWDGAVPRVRPHEDPNYLLGEIPKDSHRDAPNVRWL